MALCAKSIGLMIRNFTQDGAAYKDTWESTAVHHIFDGTFQ